MERYFPPGRTDLLFNSRLSTFPTKNYLRKCLRVMMKVSVSNALLSCFLCRRLTHTHNSTLPWYLWEKLTNFSRGRVCKPGELSHRKFGTTSPQFSSDPNAFVFDQEQAQTMADHFASSVVSTRKSRRHLVAFHHQRNWGRFKPGRNSKWNRKFPEFPNFQKKRTTSRGEPKFSKWISGKFLFHSILNRNFRKFWSNGTRP